MNITGEFDEVKYVAILRQYQPRPIHTEGDNQRAIGILEGLHASGALTPEHEALAEILTTLIEKFEEEHYALGAASENKPVRQRASVRQGCAMPAMAPSGGPVSERPGSALPPKTALSARDSEAFAEALLAPPHISESVVSRFAAAHQRSQR
jgi:hypothetical protein